jgi:predicted acylesterase/phospholipase RssA
MADALVLAGGVAKGAFAAGALGVLLGPDGKGAGEVNVVSVVGASSGALNGAFAAAVLHSRSEATEIARLPELWLEDATFGRVFEPTLGGILGLTGASGEDKVLEILRRAIRPAPRGREVELRLVVANLGGSIEMVGGAAATTFESILAFGPETFESEERLERLFHTVTASAAFPGAFMPVRLDIDGRSVQCIDGGAINNTPLRYALEHHAKIRRAFVVTSQLRVPPEPPENLHGPALLAHLADVLIGERLYRDLRAAYARNEALRRLAKEVPDPAERARIVKAIGWEEVEPLEIIEIRPEQELAGGMFDGFFQRELREQYVASGEEAARRWLESLLPG